MAAVAVKVSVLSVHRFSVSDGAWATVRDHLRSLMGCADVTIHYKDPAGDTVVIASEAEWEECRRIMPGDGLLELSARPHHFGAGDGSTSCEVFSHSSTSSNSHMGDTDIFISEEKRRNGPCCHSNSVQSLLQEDEKPGSVHKGTKVSLPSDPEAILAAMANDAMGLRDMLLALVTFGAEEWKFHFWKMTCDGAAIVAAVLKANPTARRLDLYGNDIGDAGAKMLAEAVKVNTNLQILSLHSCRIGNTGFAALAHAIACNQTLLEVDLRDNPISTSNRETFKTAVANKRATKIHF
jgi:hypothetical protein